jgi:hypothetical protein
MNLREGCGRVPIKSEGETPWTLVEFPTREDFDAMFCRQSPELRDKYWTMLNARKGGSIVERSRSSVRVNTGTGPANRS